MTDACIAGDILWTNRILHLHQDVWKAKTEIVQCRLLAQLGRTEDRIFARNTKAKRIDAPTAMAFLRHNHLWGSTKAKYYYGLVSTKTGELVAVATFSTKRKIVRNQRTFKSYELIRYCSKRNGTVVGGISKMLKAFVVEHSPDDIVTLVDRDWGPGSGWHKLGFETVNIMPPLVMVASPRDGLRRYLVGAGIQNDVQEVQQEQGTKQTTGRLGIPITVRNELELIATAKEAFECLLSYNYYPVYDAGVERLMMVVSSNPTTVDNQSLSPKDLWSQSIPNYGHSYYSENSGISALLNEAEELASNDNDDKRMASWRASSSGATTLVYSTPSSLDPNALVQVHERPGGWRTVSLVGGITKSIYHGVYKVHRDGTVDPTTNVVEYVHTMASMALAALEISKKRDHNTPFSFLHFGLGAGTLQRLIGHYLPNSQQVTVEIDTGVVAAATILPSGLRNHDIVVGDALLYQLSDFQSRYDCICVDIFGPDNMLPPVFYSKDHILRLRDNFMGPNGIIVHNFHNGGDLLRSQIQDAEASYSVCFDNCYRVDSLDSKVQAGNTVLLASKSSLDEEMLKSFAVDAQRLWGFDAFSRLKGMQRIIAPSTIAVP